MRGQRKRKIRIPETWPWANQLQACLLAHWLTATSRRIGPMVTDGPTRQFLAGKLDPDNRAHTMAGLGGLRLFDRPTLILWGDQDAHFGPGWAERLYRDTPGARTLELLPGVGQLVMEERPARVAELIQRFVSTANRAFCEPG